jgi:hypothetical protein
VSVPIRFKTSFYGELVEKLLSDRRFTWIDFDSVLALLVRIVRLVQVQITAKRNEFGSLIG